MTPVFVIMIILVAILFVPLQTVSAATVMTFTNVPSIKSANIDVSQSSRLTDDGKRLVYVEINIPAGVDSLFVTMSVEPDDDVDMTLYRAKGGIKMGTSSQGTGASESITVSNPAQGKYYLQLLEYNISGTANVGVVAKVSGEGSTSAGTYNLKIYPSNSGSYVKGEIMTIILKLSKGGNPVSGVEIQSELKNVATGQTKTLVTLLTDSNGQITKRLITNNRDPGEWEIRAWTSDGSASSSRIVTIEQPPSGTVMYTKKVNDDTMLTVTLDKEMSRYSLSIQLEDLLDNGAHTTISTGNIIFAYDRREGPQITDPQFFTREYNQDWRAVDIGTEWKTKELVEATVWQGLGAIPFVGTVTSFAEYILTLMDLAGFDPTPMPQNELFYNRVDTMIVSDHPFVGGNKDGIKLSFHRFIDSEHSGPESGKIYYMIWLDTRVRDANNSGGDRIIIDSPAGLAFDVRN